MVSLAQVQDAIATGRVVEYGCIHNVNLYETPELKSLATQAVAGRQLRILPPPGNVQPHDLSGVVWAELCEDAYSAWLAIEDLDLLEEAETPYRAIAVTEAEIRDRIPQVIAFAEAAMSQPNHYLWGGTVGPNYDCSGLVQTAFASVGVWLPRDAYQQEAFLPAIGLDELQPGDLIFFGRPDRCTHVALSLGGDRYIHSSGKDIGRNGIGIDVLSEQGDQVSRAYLAQVRGTGRVVESFGGVGSRE
ncbi:NlpC/P60 family protein [Leptolyngbya sp. AN02str]|uniref:C40 family peptidase n=1 Tax=Leptolyngbya sp. AN02str TaxID=3423363 RepID=UPI003D3120D9